MQFKKVRTVASLLMQLVSVHAHAGEGSGNPFPFAAQPETVGQLRYAADAGQERFPDLSGRVAQAPAPVAMLALAGSEAPLLSANAAPGGFDTGTVAFAQARGLERYETAKRLRGYGVAVASSQR